MARTSRNHLAARALLAATATFAVPALGQDGDHLPPDLTGEEMSQRRQHWAWQPLLDAPPPDGVDTHPVDAFLRARLHQVGAALSPAAPPDVQLRRLWFDLVGLPPPPDATQRFCAEPSDEAWRAEVDRLLASPHYGERQARHWLDLVRYSETLGHEFDYELPNAWRYRDYVVRALNDDVPFDQFVREHLAGDLLPAPRRDAAGNDESVIATGAFWFVEQAHSPLDVLQHEADRLDNQLDTIGKAVLGVTLGCARCHDHKFDAIPARDYYGLLGFLQGSRYVQAPLRPWPADSATFRAALQAQRALAAAAGLAAPADDGAAPDDGVTLRERDRVVATAARPDDGWFVTNDGFGDRPWRGPLCLDQAPAAPDSAAQLRALPGAFWCSAVAGVAREGTLHSRSFAVDERYLHVRAAGRESRIKVIVDGFYLPRDPIYGELHRVLADGEPRWLTFDLGAWRGHRAFVMAIDQRAPDLGDPGRDRKRYADDGWVAVQSIVLSPHAAPPPTAAPPPALALDLAAPTIAAALAHLHERQRAWPVSPTVPALADGTGRDGFVHVRGNPHRAGAPAPRRFLSAIAGAATLREAAGDGCGRLALADAVLDDDDPLPARVCVNRIWHHLFGRGLVRSVDNLGALGDQPTHPELLDWLARQLREHGWSQKHVLRLIVTSAAYRQDSRRGPADVDVDPENVLLHRQNVRPLEAEVLRDALLAVAGHLDPTMGGPSIEQPREAIAEARGAPKQYGPADGGGRRSIYLAVRRNFPHPMLLAFDQPTPFACVGARNRSNVPAQALTMSNDAFVRARAEELATLVCAAAPAAPARIDALYRRCFARAPSDAELQRCLGFVGEHDDAAAFADLAHALLGTTGFRFLR
ncbi:MAG: DUF1553 domain-containing protein [Planctomycetes bacterium]|nr:DUF1553 domain-containing protein [Planctomycetota bacterium]